ncbi:hypothetical protein SAMD00023353_4900080 [Rosellinia necatrix]|uniref:Uncharacterized protein n=1 Tax=Rosellinia necatrix TaxID=77044 RepID=A0A1W2TPT9_ROSNE|nr:hypothetical protein SAMD00023353_4900080 [Rosellinia necatrix]
MAEFLGLAATASLFTFSQTTLLLILDIARSQQNVLSLSEEIIILQSILKECQEIVDMEASVPESVQGALGLCHVKRLTILRILETVLPKAHEKFLHKIFRPIILAFEEPRLMAAYRSFRDTVLMLRDLTSDLRMYQQMIRVSSTMALLLSEEPADGTMRLPTEPLESFDPDHANGSPRLSEFSADVRQKRNELYMNFVSLMHFDFTRDLVLIIEVAGHEGLDRFEFVPLRNKIDTASDENFISRKILQDHKMDMGKLIPIPEEDRRQRTLEGIGGYFTPEQEIVLRWHSSMIGNRDTVHSSSWTTHHLIY